METAASSVSKMWEEYLAQIGETAETTEKTYEAWCFGSSPDELADLVLKGDKRATSSLYYWYEAEGEPLPKAGNLNIITDSAGTAKCVTETKKVTVLPFREVGAEFAFREGEGDKSLAYWQDVHRRFFTAEMAEAGKTFSEDWTVVCEEFERVYPPKK